MRRLLTVCLGVATLACALVAEARAEQQSAETVALLWQVERADAIVVASVLSDPPRSESAAREVRLRVTESLRGSLAPGSEALLLLPDHLDAPRLPVGTACICLATVDEGPGAPPRLRPVSGAFSVRELAQGAPESRLPTLVRELVAARELPAPERAAALGALLVTWMEDPDPGIAWSAATDFVSHEELHAALGPEERHRVLQAFRTQPAGRATKGALALAVAAARAPGAAEGLVEALGQPRAREVRSEIAEALRRLAEPSSEGLLLDALRTAPAPAQRCDVLVVLGAVATETSGAPVSELLRAPDTETRTEAARTLGLAARNARERSPEARIRVDAPLIERLGAAEDERETRALLWALAQLDVPEAYEALRAAAVGDAREPVRRWAQSLVERPRRSLF